MVISFTNGYDGAQLKDWAFFILFSCHFQFLSSVLHPTYNISKLPLPSLTTKGSPSEKSIIVEG